MTELERVNKQLQISATALAIASLHVAGGDAEMADLVLSCWINGAHEHIACVAACVADVTGEPKAVIH